MLRIEQQLALNPIAVALEKEEAYLPFLSQVRPIQAVVEIAREHFGKIPLAVASGRHKARHRKSVAPLSNSRIYSTPW